MALLCLTSPHPTPPHLTSPHLTSPHLTLPHLTSPYLTSPYLTSPHLTSPHLPSHVYLTGLYDKLDSGGSALHTAQHSTARTLRSYTWPAITRTSYFTQLHARTLHTQACTCTQTHTCTHSNGVSTGSRGEGEVAGRAGGPQHPHARGQGACG